MIRLVRFALLALILVCAVSLLGLVLPDAKASDRRHRLYMGMSSLYAQPSASCSKRLSRQGLKRWERGAKLWRRIPLPR